MKPVIFDGSLYVLVAVFGSFTAALASDEAAKYIGPELLFWSRTSCAASAAGLLALKMFRSTSYADAKSKIENQKSPIPLP